MEERGLFNKWWCNNLTLKQKKQPLSLTSLKKKNELKINHGLKCKMKNDKTLKRKNKGVKKSELSYIVAKYVKYGATLENSLEF